MIYPSQATRLKNFLLKFTERYETCDARTCSDNMEVVDFYFGNMQETARKLIEMLQLELVPVGIGAEERGSQQ